MSTPFVDGRYRNLKWAVNSSPVSRRAPRAGGRSAPAFGLWLKKQRLAFSKRNSYEEIERQLREAGGHFVTSSTIQRYEIEGRVPDVLTISVLAQLYDFDFLEAVQILERELTGTATTKEEDQNAGPGVESAKPLSQVAIDAATISALQHKLSELKAKYDELHDDVEGTIKHLGHAVGAKVTTTPTKEPSTRRHGKKNAG